jgi:RimJ/RimL family protein N-acetyltransferase
VKQIPTLFTERLLLRPFLLADAQEVQHLAGAREIADTTANMPHPYEDGMAESWIGTHQDAFQAGKEVTFAITLADGGGLVGAMGLIIQQEYQAELGYWIGVRYWGNGYCTEAGRAVLEYAFGDLGLRRVHAAHFRRNGQSGRVLEKLGMVQEGVQRRHFLKWGRPEDLVLYGILESEWLDR